jgi:hypothetical protein
MLRKGIHSILLHFAILFRTVRASLDIIIIIIIIIIINTLPVCRFHVIISIVAAVSPALKLLLQLLSKLSTTNKGIEA